MNIALVLVCLAGIISDFGQTQRVLKTIEADTAWSLACPDKARGWAFLVKTGSESYVVAKGKRFGPYSGKLENLVLSQDGSKWAVVEKGKGWSKLFVNGRLKLRAKKVREVAVSPDGSVWAGIVQQDKGVFVVVNGRKTGPFYNAFYLSLSRKNGKWACVVQKGRDAGYVVLINGQEHGPYADVQIPVSFSENGSFWVFATQDSVISSDGSWPADIRMDFAKPGFVARDTTWAYISQGKVVVNGREFSGYENITGLSISENGKTWAFAGEKQGKWFVVVNGKEHEAKACQAYWREGVVLSRNGASWGLVGLSQESETRCVVVNGELYGPFQDATDLVFSPNGSSWAVRIWDGEQQALLINAKEYKIKDPVQVLFSRDGSNWAVIHGVWGDLMLRTRSWDLWGFTELQQGFTASSERIRVFGLRPDEKGKWQLVETEIR